MNFALWNIFVLLCGVLTGTLITRYTSIFRPQTKLKCKTAESTLVHSTVKTKPKILCYINTHPAMYDKKAIHVQRTWARRCDKFFFTSTVKHDNLSIMMLDLQVPETRNHLWIKMRMILRELYRIADEFDYFFKADDDTYAIVDNLRAELEGHQADDPFMLGYRWNVLCPGGYFSGGAGYLLSRGALKKIVEKALDRHPHCPTTDEDKEDVKLCLCGQAVDVKLFDSIGETGISLFYPYTPNQFFKNNKLDLRTTNSSTIHLRHSKFGLSAKHISFHYVDPKMMHILEFLIYFLDPLNPNVQNFVL